MSKKEVMLANNFALPVRAVTESIAIMGRKGSGKTYTGGLLFEQMFKIGAQCVALDPVGNWWGLRLSANGKRRGLDIPVFGGEHGDIPITPESGALIAEVVIKRRLSCVIDLMLFRKGQRKKFVTAFAEELFNLKKRQRSPLHLFLEEARKFIPQKPFGPDELRMIGAFEDIVRLGRNYGLGVSLIDQRPQSVNKEVLSQTELLIVHQLTGTHERKVIKEWVQDKTTAGGDALAQLAELSPGEAFFWSPGLMRTFAKIQVGRKTTYDASSTPELGDDEDAIETKPLSDKDLAKLQESMVEVVEEVAAKDPKKLQHSLRQARAQVAAHAKTITHLEEQLENRPTEVRHILDEDLLEHISKSTAEIEELTAQVGGITALVRKELVKSLSGLPRRKAAEMTLAQERKSSEPKKKPAKLPPNGASRLNKKSVAAANLSLAQLEASALDLTGPEQRILDATAWLESIGVSVPEVNAVAFLAGYRPGGGAFNNPRGRLRSKGLISYAPNRRMLLTDEGRAAACPPTAPLDTAGLHRAILGRLGGPEGRILQPLLDAYPETMTNDDLAAAAGYSGGGGAYNNPRGRLRTLGLIDYPDRGLVRACDLLFLD